MGDEEDDYGFGGQDYHGFGGANSAARCDTCGSGNCVPTDSGEVICLDCGTQSQDVRNLVQEEWDGPAAGGVSGVGGGGIRRRAKAAPRAQRIHAEDAFTTFDFLSAIQLVLASQATQLTALCGAPPQLPGVVWDVWSRYLSRWSHACAPPVHVIDGRVAPASTTKYLAAVAAAGGRPASTVPLTLDLTLAVCYLSLRWLSVPALPHDVCAWARNGCLTYLNAFMGLPVGLRHGLAAARKFLSPEVVPTPTIVDRLATALSHNVGLSPLPPYNVGGAVARLVNQARLPPPVIALALQLLALDDADKDNQLAYVVAVRRITPAGSAASSTASRKKERRNEDSADASDADEDDEHDANANGAGSFALKRKRKGRRIGLQAEGSDDDDDGNESNEAVDSGSKRGAPFREARLLDHLTRLRMANGTGTSPGCTDVSGTMVASYVSALVATAFRCLAGWEGWVDRHLQPGCLDDVSAQRMRVGCTTGPWQEEGNADEALAAIVPSATKPLPLPRTGVIIVGPGRGDPSIGGHSSSSSDSNGAGATDASSGSVSSTIWHPDVPFPSSHDQVALMPRGMLRPYLRHVGATALSGGDLGLGRGEMGYTYAELEEAQQQQQQAQEDSSNQQQGEGNNGDDGGGDAAAAADATGGLIGAGSGATVLVRVGERAAGQALKALSAAHIAAAKGGDDEDADPYAVALGLASQQSATTGLGSTAASRIASMPRLPSRQQILPPSPPLGPATAPKVGGPALISMSSSGNSYAASSLVGAGSASSGLARSKSDSRSSSSSFLAPSSAAVPEPPPVEIAVTLGPRHEHRHPRAAGRLWRDVPALRRVDDVSRSMREWVDESQEEEKQEEEAKDREDNDDAGAGAGSSRPVPSLPSTASKSSAATSSFSTKEGAAASASASSAACPPSSSLAPDLLMFPRLRQPDRGAPALGHGEKAPRPMTDLPLGYQALLTMLGALSDVSVSEILRHTDVIELLLQLYTPLPPK